MQANAFAFCSRINWIIQFTSLSWPTRLSSFCCTDVSTIVTSLLKNWSNGANCEEFSLQCASPNCSRMVSCNWFQGTTYVSLAGNDLEKTAKRLCYLMLFYVSVCNKVSIYKARWILLLKRPLYIDLCMHGVLEYVCSTEGETAKIIKIINLLHCLLMRSRKFLFRI